MEKKSKKLMLIGLDGSSWPILDKLIELGIMPTLGKIKTESSWGDSYSGSFPTSGHAGHQ